ncbi:EAL domain-containing protein [Cryobacterium sp. Y82]|uniref:EAL domain-containing protein n=1 Tax=Cryobacterium sp. Y82 TaxID=2045017 RepID=UPI001E60D6DB|nr:EAL domain-containing protein [Cryobacterium sp. Y82]
MVEAIDSAAATLQELSELGVRWAIDDFGTGYSSFTQLRTFTFDWLKIGMTFIRGIEKSSRERGMVEGIFRLAEGIERRVSTIYCARWDAGTARVITSPGHHPLPSPPSSRTRDGRCNLSPR